MQVDKANLVFFGNIYTVNPKQHYAEAVAICGSKIIFVGSKVEVTQFIDNNTEIIETGDGMILPGLIDAHIHAQAGALGYFSCDILSAKSLNEALQMIIAYRNKSPHENWINGMGWRGEWFTNGIALASILDDILPDVPITLRRYDGHAIWANTKAIEKAGITKSTIEKWGTLIHVDSNGKPLGTFEEESAALFNEHRGVLSEEKRIQSVNLATSLLTSTGLTGYQEALVKKDGGFNGYMKSDRVMKVSLALWWNPEKGFEQIEYFKEMRKMGDEKMKVQTVKLMVDGVIETKTAYMHQPYCKCYLGEQSTYNGEGYGLNHFKSYSNLKEIVALLDEEGFQIHIHAIGDKAISDSLDAIEYAISKNGKRDRRHHIAHLQVVQPKDIIRFKELGVVANFQPIWSVADHDMVHVITPLLGDSRALLQYPIRTFIDHGIKYCFGSDWYVSNYNPLFGIHVAVNHRLYDDQKVWRPEERITLAQAIYGYTMGSAYVNFAEDVTGSIEVGKAADLIVLDKNLEKIDSSDIKNVNVLMTYIDGKKVFKKE